MMRLKEIEISNCKYILGGSLYMFVQFYMFVQLKFKNLTINGLVDYWINVMPCYIVLGFHILFCRLIKGETLETFCATSQNWEIK